MLIHSGPRASARAGVRSAHSLATEYRQWLADGADRVSPDPFEMRDAAHECRHGRLSHDAWRDPACACWAPTGKTAVTSPTITTREVELLMQQPVTEPDEQETHRNGDEPVSTEAPYGYKADGTPRKRPAPSPQQLANALAARKAKAKPKAKARAKARARAKPAVAREEAQELMSGRLAEELDTEIARLEAIMEQAADAERKLPALKAARAVLP